MTGVQTCALPISDPKGNRVDDGALTVDANNAVIGLLALTEKGITKSNIHLLPIMMCH